MTGTEAYKIFCIIVDI